MVCHLSAAALGSLIREEVSFRGWKKYLVESTLSYSQSLILTCDLYLSGNIAGGHLHSVSEIGPLELSFDQRGRTTNRYTISARLGDAGTRMSHVLHLLLRTAILARFFCGTDGISDRNMKNQVERQR